jgi:hypothetical protein
MPANQLSFPHVPRTVILEREFFSLAGASRRLRAENHHSPWRSPLMIPFRVSALVFLFLGLGVPTGIRADTAFRYPEGKHGKGQLKYVNGLPVLTVEGTPEEIGEQIGVLALKPARKLSVLLQDYLKAHGLSALWPALVKKSNALFERFPAAYRKELEAMARASGSDRDQLVVANTITDYLKVAGCSALIVEPGRSATRGPLLERNWDFVPLGTLHEYSLVQVVRPKGKHAFAMVSFPGLLGGGSAINDAGLCLAANEVTSAADGSARFNPKGVAMLVAFRHLMEDTTTVAEAENWLGSNQLTSMGNLILCDKKSGVVCEITTKTLKVRRPVDGIGSCTNHFREKGLATSTRCRRYDGLEKCRDTKRLGVAEVARLMHSVHQNDWTLHSMVFEPLALRLHLALGKGPASAQPFKRLDLAPLFKRGGP